MKNFAAIDFETTNHHRTSVCSIGVVIVRDGEIVDKFYSLVKPEPNYYCSWATECHGLTAYDTSGAASFAKVWAKIAPKIGGLQLVAHNKSFDEGCLKAFPELPNHQLHTVSAHCGYKLNNHHHALADAEACAVIGIQIFQNHQ